MSSVIWKWVIPIADEVHLFMPVGAQILDAQMQNNELCVWAMGDPTRETKDHQLHLLGTGCPVPENAGRYIATVQTRGGALVLHVFDGGPT